MGISTPQKVKLLKLMELLRENSDGEHPLKTNELCAMLGEAGISCDRRTLSKDIAVLNDCGYEILSTMQGHDKAYYIADRNFSLAELKILIDAVQAASFISESKTKNLIDKIAALGNNHRAELLRGSMVCFNSRKHSNEQIYYSVESLEEALRKRKKVSFVYFDLNENREKVYRREKSRYIVDPVALVYNEDNYYLMCFSAKHNDVVNYRVDRMEQVRIGAESADQRAVIHASNVADYTEQAFKMYNGKTETVTLEFSKALIGVVYDKFGEDTEIWQEEDGKYTANVKVQISPTFWGWLFQFGGRMRLKMPMVLREEMERQLELLADTNKHGA